MTVKESTRFPNQLYAMLEGVEERGYGDIVRWLPDGSGFQICKPKKMLPVLFQFGFQLKQYKSFTRQLQNYGYHREIRGPLEGRVTHPLFRRGFAHLCAAIKPIKPPVGVSKSEFQKALVSNGLQMMTSEAHNVLPQSAMHILAAPMTYNLSNEINIPNTPSFNQFYSLSNSIPNNQPPKMSNMLNDQEYSMKHMAVLLNRTESLLGKVEQTMQHLSEKTTAMDPLPLPSPADFDLEPVPSKKKFAFNSLHSLSFVEDAFELDEPINW